MRVIQVAPTPFGQDGLLGGGERYPLELSRALARLPDVDAELVTFGPRTRDAVDPSGLRLRVLRRVAHRGRHPAHPLAPGLPGALARRLAPAGSVVHTHHTRSAPSRVAAVVAAALRRPAVTTDHGLGGGGWGGALPALFARHLVVSAYAARTLGLPPERVHVVHGGADPTRFHPDPSARREGVLFVGRLTPHKGVDRLLRALPPGVPLRVAGTGGHDPRPPERDYPAHLRHLAAGRDVTFLDRLDDAALAVQLRTASVLAVPSVHVTCFGRQVAISELLGLVAIEAMASGTPVVASRVGGLAELVVDGETGFLVEPGDEDELRQRLDQVCRDPALAARLGRAGLEVARERFTWEACARRCLAAYDEVLAAPSTAAR